MRYIELEAAVTAVDESPCWRNSDDWYEHASVIEKSLRAIPAVDAVEVVRCRECRWWDQKEGSRYGYCYACRHNFFSPNWEISILRTYREDFFCADGERKDGEQGAVD